MKSRKTLPPWLNRQLRWRPVDAVDAPETIRAWLRDSGSLTRRLQRLGDFHVETLHETTRAPRPEEGCLLGLRNREAARIREVLLHLDGAPVVYARTVLPLRSLRGGNRLLANMARRSLGAELFRRPRAHRNAVWAAAIPPSMLPPDVATEAAWGRLSLFLKRGQPLLVAEVFLPSLWRQLEESLH